MYIWAASAPGSALPSSEKKHFISGSHTVIWRCANWCQSRGWHCLIVFRSSRIQKTFSRESKNLTANVASSSIYSPSQLWSQKIYPVLPPVNELWLMTETERRMFYYIWGVINISVMHLFCGALFSHSHSAGCRINRQLIVVVIVILGDAISTRSHNILQNHCLPSNCDWQSPKSYALQRHSLTHCFFSYPVKNKV